MIGTITICVMAIYVLAILLVATVLMRMGRAIKHLHRSNRSRHIGLP